MAGEPDAPYPRHGVGGLALEIAHKGLPGPLNFQGDAGLAPHGENIGDPSVPARLNLRVPSGGDGCPGDDGLGLHVDAGLPGVVGTRRAGTVHEVSQAPRGRPWVARELAARQEQCVVIALCGCLELGPPVVIDECRCHRLFTKECAQGHACTVAAATDTRAGTNMCRFLIGVG